MSVPEREIDLERVAQYDLKGDPWVLPIVVYDDPSFTKLGVLSSVAEATASFLDFAETNDEVKQLVENWENTNQIRKIARRAKGRAWERALESGVNIVCTYKNEGKVAVLSPHPADATPPDINRLQLSGFKNLSAGFFRERKYLPTIFVSPYPNLSLGKMVAQVSHASHLLYREASTERLQQWRFQGEFKSNIELLQPEFWDMLVNNYSPDIQVYDGGYTEIPRGTRTAVAFWNNPFPSIKKPESLTQWFSSPIIGE